MSKWKQTFTKYKWLQRYSPPSSYYLVDASLAAITTCTFGHWNFTLLFAKLLELLQVARGFGCERLFPNPATNFLWAWGLGSHSKRLVSLSQLLKLNSLKAVIGVLVASLTSLHLAQPLSLWGWPVLRLRLLNNLLWKLLWMFSWHHGLLSVKEYIITIDWNMYLYTTFPWHTISAPRWSPVR